MVSLFYFILACLVLLGKLLRFAYRLLDVLLGQVRRSGDRYLLLVTRAKILCRYMDYAIGVDVKLDLDLRNSSRRGAMPVSWNLPSVLLY